MSRKMARKRKPLNDPRHTATHEAGHAVIARVLTLACGEASIRHDHDAGSAGYSVTHDPMECENIWLQRCKLRDDGAVYRARIMAFMAGREAEAELLGSSQGGDGDDLYWIALMAEQLEHCDHERLRRMTRMLVRRHRDRIERVAAALLAEQDLSGERIDDLAGRSVADVPDRRPRDWV